MTDAEELTRAAAYRARLRRRDANERARRQRLAGSPAARHRLQQAWQPLVDALNERNPTGDPDA